MSDKTLINLLRIRACDAEFNEADHPRADNGQFTSGGGGGGAKKEKVKNKTAVTKGGGLEKYKYRAPSGLEGSQIIMSSKKTKSDLGGGDRYKFGFTTYNDAIWIRFKDDYWDTSDYAFIPLKDPAIEKAYSYSDVASRRVVSALKDSLVTNKELAKIAKQLK